MEKVIALVTDHPLLCLGIYLLGVLSACLWASVWEWIDKRRSVRRAKVRWSSLSGGMNEPLTTKAADASKRPYRSARMRALEGDSDPNDPPDPPKRAA